MASYIDRIAKVCHEAVDAWRKELGEKPAGRFERTPAAHRKAVANGVRLALGGTTPAALHQLGVTQPNAAAVALTAAFVPYTQLPEDQKKKAALFVAVTQALGCGQERWDVKTGTDAAAAQVNMTPVLSTIAELVAFPAPPPDPPIRVAGGPEFQVYTINVTVTQAKEEADSDYHLALSDGQGNTMIAEAACPGCASGSSWLPQITSARQAVEAAIPGVAGSAGSFVPVNRQVTISGPGFFDRLHGQTGVAPNGAELHPILEIQFT